MTNLRLAVCHLESTAPYSQGSYLTSPRATKMKAAEHDELHWRERAHTVRDGPDAGHMFIPAQQFKNALLDAAKFLGMKVQGRGNNTYAKHFAAGVMVPRPLVLPDLVAALVPELVMCSADGKPGGSTKVLRRFPVIPAWAGRVDFIIADETIDEATFREHLAHAGALIGIGRWRPIKNGNYGRFVVKSCEIAPYSV